MRSDRDCIYARIYRWTYGTARVAKILRALDIACVALTACAYLFALIFKGVSEKSLMTPLRLAIATGVPFLAVSLLRHILDLPRPREVFEIDFLPGKKMGKSFPSRHVFSAFAIGTALCFTILPLGITVLILGFVTAGCRVCLGNHFIRDVIAGALIGTACSVIGMLIL